MAAPNTAHCVTATCADCRLGRKEKRVVFYQMEASGASHLQNALSKKLKYLFRKKEIFIQFYTMQTLPYVTLLCCSRLNSMAGQYP